MELFNQNSLTTDKNGNVKFSGISSGIDFQGAVDSIMQAKRIPVDRLETRIEDNGAKITALNALGGRLSDLREAVNTLRGAVSVDRSTDAFAAKQAFSEASRADSTTPSQAAAIMGVNVTNRAEVGSHQIEVLQRAAAHRLAAGTANSQIADLGTAYGGAANSISGEFTINGTAIQVNADDSLVDLRDRINNANSGDSATGVTASIVQISDDSFSLVLSADETGQAIELSDTTNTPLEDIGVLSGGAIANEIQAPQNAKLKADGLTVANALQSTTFASAETAIDSGGGAQTLEITNDATGEVYTIDYDASTDSLRDVANRIDQATSGGAGEDSIAAAVVEENGEYRLQITRSDGGSLSFTDSGGSFALGAASDVERVITRESNTVDDLFQGMTLDLFKAEPGTTVEVGVERNLNEIKTAITDFVDAYNGVKQYLNAQRGEIALEGQDEDEVGALAGNRVLSDIESQLNNVFALGAQNVDGALEVLGQIGIDFIDNDDVSDPTRADTLKIDESELNDVLLNDPESMRELFAFGFDSDDPSVSMLGYSGQTQPSGSGYQLEITHDGTEITAATLDGSTSAVSFSGNTITVTDESGAQGLRLFYNGGATAGTTVNFDVSRGIGANMHATADDLLDETTGLIESEIDNLKDQNERAETDIGRLERRLAYQRDQLIDSFIRMEEALARMETIQSSIQGLADSLNSDN